jgi:hypothetical protein
MVLSDSAIRNAKPAEKPYKLFDDGGLFLLVAPTGSRLWRLKYRFWEKKLLALGPYPTISLKEARERRDIAKKQLAHGVDPAVDKKVKAVAAAIEAANTVSRVDKSKSALVAAKSFQAGNHSRSEKALLRDNAINFDA